MDFSLTDLIKARLLCVDDEEVALGVLRTVLAMKRADVRALLGPVLTDEVRRQRRAVTRAAEHAARTSTWTRSTTTTIVEPITDQDVEDEIDNLEHGIAEDLRLNPVTEERLALLKERFYAPDFGYVLWGTATVEMHENRIGMSTKQMSGIEASIRLHVEAIEEIKEAGVENLNAVYGV